MTLQTHDDLTTNITTLLADNTTGAISESDLRTIVTNLLDGIWRKNVTSIDDTDSPYTVDLEVTQILLADPSNGSITVNLPAVASSANKILTVKDTGTPNSVTLDGNGSETIDGSTTYALSTQNDSVTIICDGTQWDVIGSS